MKPIDVAQSLYPNDKITNAYESDSGDMLFCFGEIYDSMWVLVKNGAASDMSWPDAHELAVKMKSVPVAK